MMEEFPYDYELIGLFESEPILTDPGIPWRYNHLKFLTVLNAERLECEIEPGDGTVQFRWFRDEVELVNLDMRQVTGLKIEVTKGVEALHLLFSESCSLERVIVWLKPTVHIFLKMKGT